MREENRKLVWSLILDHGDKIDLPPHSYHPKGRNTYAHICGEIKKKYGCTYKDISDKELESLIKFINEIGN